MKLGEIIVITSLVSNLLITALVSLACPPKKTIQTVVLVDTIKSIPHFPGGQDSLAAFLKKNMHWPEPQIDVEGKVIVGFTVTLTGRITNIKVVKSLYKSFDKEALRVVRLMPLWVPAKINGKNVSREYTLPINFTIASD